MTWERSERPVQDARAPFPSTRENIPYPQRTPLPLSPPHRQGIEIVGRLGQPLGLSCTILACGPCVQVVLTDLVF